MTGYDIMCNRNKTEDCINYLSDCLKNNTGTALLDDDEIKTIIDCLTEARTMYDLRLSTLKVD